MNIIETDTVIIGAGLTGLTLAFYLKRSGKKIIMIEKEKRVGGVINTLSEKGFTFETGPNTGIIGTLELVALFEDLNDRVHVEVASPNAASRWIWKNNRWNILPNGLINAVCTPLFSIKDKIRILGEPFRKPGAEPFETIADTVIRRLGRSYLDYAVDPFISGIYAGDPKQLITRYALPKLYNLEQNYGSFILGAIKKKLEPKSGLEKKVNRKVFSVKGGLINLIHALHSEINANNILLGCKKTTVGLTDQGFKTDFIHFDGKPFSIYSKHLVTATDGTALPAMLPFVPSRLLTGVTQINYAKIVQVVACYSKWDGILLNAFGGLFPSKENRSSLGILFPSTLFENRAPGGGAILSVFMGGMNNPEIIHKSDNEIKRIVLAEIKETLKTEGKPDLLRIFRYEKAIPQYEKTSGARLQAINDIQNRYPGLILAGNIRDGIGMADRVKQAKHLAIKLTS